MPRGHPEGCKSQYCQVCPPLLPYPAPQLLRQQLLNPDTLHILWHHATVLPLTWHQLERNEIQRTLMLLGLRWRPLDSELRQLYINNRVHCWLPRHSNIRRSPQCRQNIPAVGIIPQNRLKMLWCQGRLTTVQQSATKDSGDPSNIAVPAVATLGSIRTSCTMQLPFSKGASQVVCLFLQNRTQRNKYTLGSNSSSCSLLLGNNNSRAGPTTGSTVTAAPTVADPAVTAPGLGGGECGRTAVVPLV